MMTHGIPGSTSQAASRLMAWTVVLTVFGFMLFRPAPCPAADAITGAHDLVRTTSAGVLKILRERHDELEKKPGLIYGVVEEHILPHFDFERMSQLVLGKNWRAASAEQQRQFMDEFRLLLVRTYATAMLKYSDEDVSYLPTHGNPQDSEVVVQTEVEQPGGEPIPIDYMLYRKNADWKVFDVKINNVSLVLNYRSTFGTEIRGAGGVGGLIEKLHERNQQAANE